MKSLLLPLLLAVAVSVIDAAPSAKDEEDLDRLLDSLEDRVAKMEDHFARQSENAIHFDAYLGLGDASSALWPGGTQLLFQGTNANVGGAFDLARSEFRAPQPGSYALFFQAECLATYNHCHVELRKNGVIVNDGFHDDSVDFQLPTQTFWFAVLNLETDDVITVATSNRQEDGEVIAEDVLYYAVNHIRFYGYLLTG